MLKWTATASVSSRLLITLTVTAGLLLIPPAKSQTTFRPDETAPTAPLILKPVAGAQASISNLIERLPLSFEANQGQTDSRVKFLSRGAHQTLFLTPTESVFVFTNSDRGGGPREKPMPPTYLRKPEKRTRSVLRMAFVGANPQAHVIGVEELPGKSNYFIGNDPTQWHTNVPTYDKVKYENVYPGIDLLFYGNQRALEYDFVVRPGADVRRIALRFAGAKLYIDNSGDLVLRMGAGTIRQKRPVVYQQVDGARHEVGARYVRKGVHEVGVQVDDYDASRPLIIDPTLFYSTYLGGSGDDRFDGARSIAVDGAGNPIDQLPDDRGRVPNDAPREL
jgi:hypothetical protein